MKTKLIIPFFILMVAFTMSGLHAQDTIDTTYYRYNFHRPHRVEMSETVAYPPYPPMLIDSITGQYVIDNETGENIPACPNGLGFSGLRISPATTWFLYNPDPPVPMYYSCFMKQPMSTIYGLSFYLDHIKDFTVGDSAEFVLAERSSETGRISPFDTIGIKGGEVGIYRKLEVPLMSSNGGDVYWHIQSSCIDTVRYVTVMEFYLNTPHQLVGDTLFISPRFAWNHGSQFYVAHIDARYFVYNLGVAVYDEDIYGFYMEDWVFGDGTTEMLYATPIIEPLPDWEVALLDTLIPMPTKPENPDPDPNDPNNPDNPGDPNDPDDPDDPNNPDNPDDPNDPEDPTDPEAINGVYGNLPISIYPNPTNGVTTISSPEAIKELTVTDLAGRVLLHHSSLGTSTTLDTAPLEPGLYLLKMTTASGTATTKLAVR